MNGHLSNVRDFGAAGDGRAKDTALRIGFVAESDSHDGMPGSGPLTAATVDELSRESILEALRARRVYAITGARIEVNDFRLAGAAMGQAVDLPGRDVPLAFRIVGTRPGLHAELVVGAVGDGVPLPTVAEWESDTETLDVDDMVMLDDRLDFTYIRITDSDGQQAWVSPVWLNDA